MKFKIITILSLIILNSVLFSQATTLSPQQQELLDQLPQDQRQSVEDKMMTVNEMDNELEEIFEQENVLIERPEIKDGEECKKCVFGYSMFRFAPTTFAPSNNVPISSTYKLGPGDKVKLNYYGTEQLKSESFISRDGTFELPLLGPINLAGLSIEEAKNLIKTKVDSELIGTTISFNITELRSISVYVLGEAYKPGSYTLSSLSSVVNALYLSGGPNENGSLRNIKVRRNTKDYNFDLYDLLIHGSLDNDLRLEDGDVVFIPFIEKTVSMKGGFKRPFLYEIKEGETLEDAVMLAGGYSFETGLNPKIEYSTINKENNQRETARLIDNNELKIKVQNGDSLTVSEVRGLNSKSIEIAGEVKRPGIYNLNEGDRILDLITRAGGYTNQAYANGIIFTREQVAEQQRTAFQRTAEDLEKTMIDYVSNSDQEVTEYTLQPIINLISKLKEIEPIGRQVVDFNLLKLKTNPMNNFQLFDGDRIIVPDRPQSIYVVGEVLNPATLQFSPDKSIEDYISLS